MVEVYKERVIVEINSEENKEKLEKELKQIFDRHEYRLCCTDFTHPTGTKLYFTQDK